MSNLGADEMDEAPLERRREIRRLFWKESLLRDVALSNPTPDAAQLVTSAALRSEMETLISAAEVDVAIRREPEVGKIRGGSGDDSDEDDTGVNAAATSSTGNREIAASARRDCSTMALRNEVALLKLRIRQEQELIREMQQEAAYYSRPPTRHQT